MSPEGPIRVLNLFTIMNRGGAETMVMNYYRNIDRTMVQFDFMVHRQDPGAYDKEIEALGGHIYRMPAIRPWTAKKYRHMVRQFYHEHGEYKIIHSHMSELGYYDFLEAEKAGVPVRICHAHNRPHIINTKTLLRSYYKARMMPHITHMFTCGQESAEWLFGKQHRDSFIMLNNAIDARAYSFSQPIRDKLRTELGVQDKFVVGHVGRFAPQKNHGFIIDVFAQLVRRHPQALLLLVGEDKSELGEKVHQKVKRLGLTQSVKFLGVRSDVPDIMQAMDVFLFPSFHEGLSVASIEAQAAGLPVFISDGIPRECIKTDLVQVEKLETPPEVWAEQIWEARTIPRTDRYEEIKACGFDIQENAKKLQQFYLDTYLENV